MLNKIAVFLIPLSLMCFSIPSAGNEELILEEVLVSALREATAEDLPASITVLNAQNIESSSAEHFQELFQQIPNLNYSGEGSRARYFQVRGIGELEQYEGAPNPSVGFIVDDIDLSGVGGITSLFDVGRIEVLRGPQATRFGANAIAGLVYVQSQEAMPEHEFRARISLGSDDQSVAAFSAGGALNDRLNGRVSVHQLKSNGFYSNQALGREDTNGRDETMLHTKLHWDLNNDWGAIFNLLVADFDNGYDAWSPLNGQTTYSDHPGRDEQQTTGASLRLSGPLGSKAELVSISSFADSDILFSYDGEWGNSSFWAPYDYDYFYSDNRKRKTHSQEFRLVSTSESRLFHESTDWLVGIYTQQLDESNRILSEGVYDDSVDAPFSYCSPCLDRSRLNSEYESTNTAIFAKLDRRFNDRLSVSLGARLERWNAEYQDIFIDEIYGDPNAPVQNGFSPAENLWGGDLGLVFDVSEQSSVYGLVSRGYKAGGFNPSLARATGNTPDVGGASISFRPEALLNIELGLKGSWMNDRLSGELSLFLMERDDMQLRSSAQYTDNPNDFIYITSNAEGRSRGLEASLNWVWDESWVMHGNLGLLNSEIESYSLEREVDITGTLIGRSFAHAPDWTVNAGFSYRGPETQAGAWSFRFDVNAMDGFYFDYSHDERAGSRLTADLKISRYLRNWEVSAWVRNLFDEEYHSRGFSFGLTPPYFERTRFTRLGDPRHFGLTLDYRY
jgi:outer membrane receptor protein involved in Fe transport